MIYPSYFKLQVRWLRYSAHFMSLAPSGPLPAAFKSAYANLSLTPVTYLSKLLGIRSIAAFLQLELFRVYNAVSDQRHIATMIRKSTHKI